MTCKALARLHRKRVVHGSLTPDNVLWFGGEDLVKLSSFSFWAFDGTNIPLHPALRYAPPEVPPLSNCQAPPCLLTSAWYLLLDGLLRC